MPNNYDIAWALITGRDDEWAGCAQRAEVERIASLIRTSSSSEMTT